MILYQQLHNAPVQINYMPLQSAQYVTYFIIYRTICVRLHVQVFSKTRRVKGLLVVQAFAADCKKNPSDIFDQRNVPINLYALE